MPSLTPLRLRLKGEPGRLAGFDVDNALRKARSRLRQLRDDVELLRIEQRSADSVEVALLVPPSVRRDDIDGIAAVLRESLELGAGRYVPIPGTGEEVRGIGGQGSTCPVCRASEGSHVPGCPRSRR